MISPLSDGSSSPLYATLRSSAIYFLKSARQVEALSRGARGTSAPTWWATRRIVRSPSAVSGTLSSVYAAQLRGWDLMKGRRTVQAVLSLPIGSRVYLTLLRIAAVIAFPVKLMPWCGGLWPTSILGRISLGGTAGRRGASGEVLHMIGARRRLRPRGFCRRLVETPAGKTHEDWMEANRLHQHRRSANKKRAPAQSSNNRWGCRQLQIFPIADDQVY